MPLDDRDSRRHRDPLHSLEQSGEFDTHTPVEIPRRREPTVDASAFDIDIRWAQFDDMRAEVAACKAERLTRERRKGWMRGLIGGGGAVVVTVLAFLVRALVASGAAAEAGRAQSQLVQDNANRIRVLEQQAAASNAVLAILQARLAGRRTPDPEP